LHSNILIHKQGVFEGGRGTTLVAPYVATSAVVDTGLVTVQDRVTITAKNMIKLLVSVCACVCVRLRVCMHVCIYVLCVCIYIYIYMVYSIFYTYIYMIQFQFCLIIFPK
jgi:hypothetical protein